MSKIESGLVVIERRNSELDQRAGYTCVRHTFYDHLKEPWAKSPKKLLPKMKLDPLGYLQRKGYEVVDEPVIGGAIAYAVSELPTNIFDSDFESPIEILFSLALNENRIPPYIEHFGIYLGEGRVRSKLGAGDIVEHPLSEALILPSSYSTILFLNKRPD